MTLTRKDASWNKRKLGAGWYWGRGKKCCCGRAEQAKPFEARDCPSGTFNYGDVPRAKRGFELPGICPPLVEHRHIPVTSNLVTYLPYLPRCLDHENECLWHFIEQRMHTIQRENARRNCTGISPGRAISLPTYSRHSDAFLLF